MTLMIETNPVKLLIRIRNWLSTKRMQKIEKAGGQSYKDSDLVYAAYARCLCGAGMAYPKGCGPNHFWDCSDILTGRAVPQGQSGSVKHEARLPFIFYEIKSESQPSANGATTRNR